MPRPTTTYVALLRAVNLAGKNMVSMSALREFLTSLGAEDARTLLQSGNAVFRSDAKTSGDLETKLERASKKAFGFEIEFFVRSADEWEAVVAANPFPREASSDPGRLITFILKRACTVSAVKALQDAIAGREVVRAKDSQAYVFYPEGQGRSRLTAAIIEKHLGARGTGRNWNTVLKLQAMVAS